jgi:ubiquinone/menaquinone biosynthesis C-methylase UbiE
MSFPDKQRVYLDALRVLKPGGQFLFNVWDRIETNDLTLIVHKTVSEMYPTVRQCSMYSRRWGTTTSARSGPTSPVLALLAARRESC